MRLPHGRRRKSNAGVRLAYDFPRYPGPASRLQRPTSWLQLARRHSSLVADTRDALPSLRLQDIVPLPCPNRREHQSINRGTCSSHQPHPHNRPLTLRVLYVTSAAPVLSLCPAPMAPIPTLAPTRPLLSPLSPG
ncbi:hypothetical protein BKA56DRAFT_339238 [Ilyonectria sp. MPI-CAGE-AT-0026]|nr:hypothetical protein BKA56DRAFT_339238 [Ilyonectria sp. MPI-CAGE-AT-0026]